MAVMVDDVKRALHEMVDRLPADQAAMMLRALQGDRRALYLASIPEDDEPVTNEERAAVAEAEEDVRAGHALSFDEVYKKYVRRH